MAVDIIFHFLKPVIRINSFGFWQCSKLMFLRKLKVLICLSKINMDFVVDVLPCFNSGFSSAHFALYTPRPLI